MLDEIEELENRISLLPNGYISKKTINGKIRYYRQWKENGKVKSQYIPDSEYEDVKKSIARRKELESRLILCKKENSNLFSQSSLPLEMNAIYGSTLKSYGSLVKGWKERTCCEDIRSYIQADISPRVCVLYGLRRTGKTTMLLQVINSLSDEDFKKAVYIKARKKQTMNMLDRDLKTLYNSGFRFVFLDEVTMIDDFIDTASFLSDIYAAIGMKIVLSGTDSLGLWFADREELYDRTVMVHTTWIPFSEHASLLGVDDIDEYIRFGGTLKAGETDFDDPLLKNEEISFRDDESTRRYIDTSICKNIQHSLKCYEGGEHFRHLLALYENNELAGMINRIIESMNHRFVLSVLTRNFESNDLALARKNMLREKDISQRTDILDKIDTDAVTRKLMEILEIKNRESVETELNEDSVFEIEEYLKALELIAYVPIRTYGSRGGYEKQTILTQPGMRYCQAEALVYSLLKDPVFDHVSNEIKDYVSKKILDEVKGRMMEEIIQFETMKRNKQTELYKMVFDVGEFDMVVYDKNDKTCKIYEIKHSGKRDKDQVKHLLDEEKCRLTEEMVGKITEKAVLYRGETVFENGISYINVSDYLKRY